MKTTLTLDKEDKTTIKDYTNKLDITQAQFIKILLNLAKKFPKELVKQARGEFE